MLFILNLLIALANFYAGPCLWNMAMSSSDIYVSGEFSVPDDEVVSFSDNEKCAKIWKAV